MEDKVFVVAEVVLCGSVFVTFSDQSCLCIVVKCKVKEIGLGIQ